MATFRVALMALAVFALVLAATPEAHAKGRPGGRSLKAGTDERYNFYSNKFPDQNIMVCDDCTGSLEPSFVDDVYDGNYYIWVGGQGQIVNNGDGGFDNWQFRSCPGGGFTRFGDQGHTVNFNACPTNNP